MFRLKKTLNCGAILPDLIKIDTDTAYSFTEDIKAGMALYLTSDKKFIKCPIDSRPTHVCEGVFNYADGEKYMLCYSIGENMIFEAPIEDSEDQAFIGSPVFVAEDGLSVKFDKNSTKNTGVIFSKNTPYKAASLKTALVQFPSRGVDA